MTKEKEAKKFVEAPAEMELSEPVRLVEKEEATTLVADEEKPAGIEVSAGCEKLSGSALAIHSPANFVRLNAANAVLFLLFPVACCLTTLFLDPRLMGNSYCRTAIFCAFIWNLIGGVIFAQSRKSWERRLLFWIFAMPFAVSGIICSSFFPILLVLMQHLPPGLK